MEGQVSLICFVGVARMMLTGDRSEEVKDVILREATNARRDGYVLRGVKVGEEGMET